MNEIKIIGREQVRMERRNEENRNKGTKKGRQEMNKEKVGVRMKRRKEGRQEG